MTQLLTIFTALLFLAIGYVLGRYQNDQEVIKKAIKQIKKLKNPVKAGVLDYPSQEDIDYHESGEDEVDQTRTELFQKYFKNDFKK